MEGRPGQVPAAKLVQWEPLNRDSSRVASKAAFGEYTDAQYKLENADVILSLDADFLAEQRLSRLPAPERRAMRSAIATRTARP